MSRPKQLRVEVRKLKVGAKHSELALERHVTFLGVGLKPKL